MNSAVYTYHTASYLQAVVLVLVLLPVVGFDARNCVHKIFVVRNMQLVPPAHQLSTSPHVGCLPTPLSVFAGQTLPPCATDVFEYDALGAVFQDCKSESATHYQRAAAFRCFRAVGAAQQITGSFLACPGV